jgi:hypothetical protein
MAFSIISAPLAASVAQPVANFMTVRYGKAGFKVETGIRSELSWSPTIQVNRTKFELLAIEVSEDLYPMILKIVAHDISRDIPDVPISVYVACPLTVYLADAKQITVRKLKDHGFGLITVDDTGHVTEQFSAIPLIHQISEVTLADNIKALPSGIRVKFKNAFDLYRTNSNQGLQDTGQLVEGLIYCMAKHSHKKGWIANPDRMAAASMVDLLYAARELNNYRAALGAARNFLKSYRNMASHPPKSYKAAAEKIKLMRNGFIDSLNTTVALCGALKELQITIRLFE